jgi:hypothetical protein
MRAIITKQEAFLKSAPAKISTALHSGKRKLEKSDERGRAIGNEGWRWIAPCSTMVDSASAVSQRSQFPHVHMYSPVDRRHFLRQGLTLAGGALLLPFGDLALGAPSAGTISRPNEEILKLIAAFGRNVTYCGASVTAILTGRTPVVTSLRAEIFDFAAFAKACSSWRAYGLEIVRAAGSTITVLASGQLFEIEALPARDYVKASAGAAGNAVFAHDALSLVPGAKQAVDPLRAGDSLRLIRQSSGANALGDILRGRIDAAESGLIPDASFVATESSVLAGTVSDSATADSFVRTFFAHVTALATALPAGQMAALASSRLITSAVHARLGVSIEKIARESAARFAPRARTTNGHPMSAAAIWLASALAGEIQAGRGPRWIATDSIARLVAATAALAEAQSFVGAPVKGGGPARPGLTENAH